jgi:hypothetical protein
MYILYNHYGINEVNETQAKAGWLCGFKSHPHISLFFDLNSFLYIQTRKYKEL